MPTYHEILHSLSERIVHAQRPIRILDALKWDAATQLDFFKNNAGSLPKITPEFYQSNALKFDAEDKLNEFYVIERDIKKQLGQFNSVGKIMQRMCREYCTVIHLLQARGKPSFTHISQELYGSSLDAFYAGAPTLHDLALTLSSTFNSIQKNSTIKLSEMENISSELVVDTLQKKLNKYFANEKDKVKVILTDDIIADASAGAECLKIRRNAKFSKRDIKIFEVHEGWVHLGTTINGLKQPVCTFLSKGPPSSTVTQEGLAIIMEIFTFSSHPARMQKLSDRITAIYMAEQGADFLEVYRFFINQDHTPEESYHRASRVFRGSLPNAGPFTKDLVYNKGFILIYNYIRIAIQKGLLHHIPLLFLGKTTLEDLHVLNDLVEEGVITPPEYVPPQFKDLAALSAWMSYSLFLNQLDIKQLTQEYKNIF